MTEEQIIKSGKLSPGLIDGIKHHFLAHSSGEFYHKPDGAEAFVKDEKGKYKLLPRASVLVARQSYLEVHLEAELTQATELKVVEMGKELIRTTQELIQWLEDKVRWSKAGEERQPGQAGPPGGINVVQEIIKQNNPEMYQTKKEEAVAWVQANPTVVGFLDQLRTACQAQDFEELYSLTGRSAEPLIIVERTDKLHVLKRMFSAQTVENTAELLKTRGTLYVRARVKVEERYFRE